MVFFSFFTSRLQLINSIFQSACSEIKNDLKVSLNLISLSSSKDDSENEIITVVGSYDSLFHTILSKNSFSHFSSLNDSSDYLKDFPGFFSMRNGGTNADIVFRGMFGSRLRILDGASEILGCCAARMDSSAYIFPETFDIVTVIKGPQTVLWGPVASGAIVRFDRSNPRFYGSEVKMNTSTMMGSYNRLDKNVDTFFGNSSGYLRLIGTVSHSNDYLDAKKRIVPSEWYKWNTNIIFGLTPISDFLFEVVLSQSNGNAKYAARGVDAMCFARESFEIRFKKDCIQDSVYSIDLSGWYHYINHIMGTDMKHIHVSDKLLIKRSNLFINENEKNNIDRVISGARSIFTYQSGDVQIHYGVDMQSNQHGKKILNESWYRDSCFRDIGLFLELDWKLMLFSKVVSGIRMEHTLVNYYPLQEQMKQRKLIYPAGFMRYEHIFLFPDLLSVYAGVGMNERFPDYWELIVLKSGKSIGRDSFYRLKEEKSIQLDFGGHFKSEKLNFWISSYLGYIEDFILYRYYDHDILVSNNVYDSGSSAENINAISQGSEIGCSYRLNNNLILENNMSYVVGKNITDCSSLPQLPPLDSKMILSWEYGLWTTKCIWRIVASQSRISVNNGNIISRDINVSKGFSTLSFNLLRQVSDEIKLGFGVNNLLNKMYSEHLNMIGNKRFKYLANSPLFEPGRTWWMRIGVMF